MHEFGVYIGRFQPFHNAHLATVRFAFQQVKHLVIIIGSDNQARNVKNPWSTAERIAMITGCLTDEERAKVTFVPMRDYLYNDNIWIAEIQRQIAAHTGTSKDVVLIGHAKDASSFYLKLFPQWKFVQTDLKSDLDASKVRVLMFTRDTIGLKNFVPQSVNDDINAYMKLPEFERLHDEYHHILDYRSKWHGAPFPPTFNTVDAIVIRSGHVLVVRRGGAPGKGLIALPGGYLNVEERIIDGAIRELKEETGIKIPIGELKKAIVDQKVFDHPSRSLRGRTITHAFCINLGQGELPEVKGMDDADKAWWMPLDSVYSQEARFFEDHFHIISYFVNRV
jgi:bifunctional NMN adenylyltransferase/nudix hydrolase